MYTSDTIINNKKFNARNAVTFLAVTAFCGFFSSVYLSFSHGVSSPFMVYLAIVPFSLGVLPYSLLYLLGAQSPTSTAKQLYNGGAITVLIGSLVKGIVEISGYEATNIAVFGIELNYSLLYFSVGIILMFIGVSVYFKQRLK